MTELFSALDIAEITGGTLFGSKVASVSSVCIDSRKAVAGALFVPLPGRHTDGHEFIGEALRAGAAVSLVARSFVGLDGMIASVRARGKGTLCVVDSPLAAMQSLARAHLSRFPGLTRIGVTGSNGKTTTKELLRAILAQCESTFATEGNLNSDIGLPLSAFGVRPQHRFAVFEMAMNRRGEIAELAEVVRPHLALITNIGTAHIGMIGSQEAIAFEKKQIFSRFTGWQTGLLYENEPFRAYLSRGVRGHIRYFGESSTEGFEGVQERSIERTVMRYAGRSVHLGIPGESNLRNALAAITAAAFVGCSPEHVEAGLSGAKAVCGRGELFRGRVTVFHDAYNANPESMKSFLQFAADIPWSGRKVYVLGAMKELGAESAHSHVDVAAEAAGADAAELLLFGEEFEEAAGAVARSSGAARGRRADEVDQGSNGALQTFWTDDFETLKEELRKRVRSGDLVVLKGSRSAALERLVPLLKEDEA